jgi:hypothetical protein
VEFSTEAENSGTIRLQADVLYDDILENNPSIESGRGKGSFEVNPAHKHSLSIRVRAGNGSCSSQVNLPENAGDSRQILSLNS